MRKIDIPLAFTACAVLVVVAAIIAAPTDHGPNGAADQKTDYWEWIRSAAFWTAMFTGVLTWSTVQLWRETRRLASGAEKQYREVERAFLSIDVAESAIIKNAAGVLTVQCEIGCTNSGTTPTRCGLSHVSWQYFEKGGPESVGFKDIWSPRAKAPSGLAIGPKVSTNLEIVEFDRDLLHAATGTVFIWGWVEYDDVFDGTPRHRTEFCYEIVRFPKDGGFDMRFRCYNMHNGYDDECYRKPSPYKRPSTI